MYNKHKTATAEASSVMTTIRPKVLIGICHPPNLFSSINNYSNPSSMGTYTYENIYNFGVMKWGGRYKYVFGNVRVKYKQANKQVTMERGGNKHITNQWQK